MSEPNVPGRTSSAYKEISIFATKACIAAVIAALTVNWVVEIALSDANDVIMSSVAKLQHSLGTTKLGGHQFWAKVQKSLDDAAASDLPPAEKTKAPS